MGTLITTITSTIADADKAFAHGLGTTPDYINLESIEATNTTLLHLNIVSYNDTTFTLIGSVAAPGTSFRATAVKVHSIAG